VSYEVRLCYESSLSPPSQMAARLHSVPVDPRTRRPVSEAEVAGPLELVAIPVKLGKDARISQKAVQAPVRVPPAPPTRPCSVHKARIRPRFCSPPGPTSCLALSPPCVVSVGVRKCCACEFADLVLTAASLIEHGLS